MKSIVNLIFLFVFAQFQNNGIAQPASSAWPMLQHDPQHTGRSPYAGPENPTVKWVYESDEEATSSPVVGLDGTIYFCEGSMDGATGTSGKLIALDSTGALKWKLQLGAIAGVTAPVIGADGTIYLHRSTTENLLGTAAIIAVNPDGTIKWKYEDEELFSTEPPSPTIAQDGTIYVPFEEVCLYAFEPTGEVKWIFLSPSMSSISSSPAIGHDGTIYITDCSYFLYAIDSTGVLKWQYNLYPGAAGSACGSTCVGTDGTIYVTDYDSSLAAINPNGTLKWICNLGSLVFYTKYCTPVIGNDGIIYVSGGGNLNAISPEGNVEWTYPMKSDFLVIDKNSTIYGRGTDCIEAINPDGTLKWIWDQPIYTPLLSWGAISPSFCMGSDGTLYITSAKHWYYDEGINGIYALNDSVTTIVRNNRDMPNKFSISQNYPNPFNPTTTIKYSAPKSSHVKLLVYNTLGEEVKELINEFKSPGEYEVKFEAENLPSGVYFYIITFGNNTITRKMLLLK